MATGSEGDFLKRFGPFKGMTVLETGSNHGFSTKLRALCEADKWIGVDMQAGKTVDLVHNLEEPLPDGLEPDVIISFSTLEHCKKPWLVAENLIKCLKPGGLLLISVPFQWRVHAYPSDYYRFTPDGVKALFEGINFFATETDPAKTQLGNHVNGHVLVLMAGNKP